MSRHPLLFSALFLVMAAPAAWANDKACPCDVDDSGKTAEASHWTGGGELGFASARGNSINESLNGRFNLQYTQGDWIHSMDLFGLRARAEYRVEDENGEMTRSDAKTTANRYTVGVNSALKLDEHRQFTTAVRAEQDDFATYDRLQTASIGYGTRMMDGERTKLDVQVGPGFRRAHNAEDDVTETGVIGRGFVGLKFDLTDNTELSNNLLVESGSHNTYAQNDLGVSVAMNSHLALKAGLQARRNSEVEADRKKTDTLTTMNVVYRFK
jgi:putative salt-induced outer membrane protein